MNNKALPQKQVIIMGCGDVGQRVARIWQKEHAQVIGITRSQATAEQLEAQGIPGWACDLDNPSAALPEIQQDSLIYYFVPPPAKGTTDLHCRRFLELLINQTTLPARIVAISTTGVYGNRHGERVTEEDAPHPQVDRAYRRYDMECQLHKFCEQQHIALILLRVGGIYGPGRLPLQRIKQQIPVLHEHLAPQTNRIHVDDLTAICKAAAEAPFRYRIYNVSDGTDSNMTEYFFTLADHFNLPRPPAVDWKEAEQTMSAGMLSYLRESRHIDNSRMLNELNIKLEYPNLRAGLASCESEEQV